MSHAQFSSPALDPQCYQPKPGTPQFDTIYGTGNDQFLGYYVINLPDALDTSKRYMAVYNLVYQSGYDSSKPVYPYSFSAQAPVNIHKLQAHLLHVTIGGYVKAGHFRSARYADLFLDATNFVTPRIYWSDENGNYDSSRFSEIRFKPLVDSQSFDYEDRLTPYVGKFSSDTLDDIVVGGAGDYPGGPLSFYLGLFRGGEGLFKQGHLIYPDSELKLKDLDNIERSHGYSFRGTQTDLQGIGTDDYVAADMHGNLFHYKFQRPFSLTEFARSMREDTIFAGWQNPNSYDTVNSDVFAPFFTYTSLGMRALPKSKDDKSFDLVVPIRLHNSQENESFYFFRGGPSFGSKRLFIDSADFRLYPPGHYDDFEFGNLGWPAGYFDCGDMTGTGNNVLCITSSQYPSPYNYFFFYVLGNAIDDKVDMFIPQDHLGGLSGADTLDANGDGLGDLMIGMADFITDHDAQNNLFGVGSLGILYGSKQIPVHGSGVVPNQPLPLEATISVNPNPAGRHIMLTLEAPNDGEIAITIRDILGRMVYEETRTASAGEDKIPILLPLIQSGIYYVQTKLSGVTTKSLPLVIISE
ncbi:MAG TPA: T9SS type A sorting domain-containing protein [Candidatus Kapabacteria bacterium]|nr:T9SS type A sorting domain-containing protein [Candidatus Kapabacteria bacterium]